MSFEDKIEEMFIDIPEIIYSEDEYPHFCKSGKLIFLKNILPVTEGRLVYKGRVGSEISIDKAVTASKAAFVYALGILKRELKSIDMIKRIVSMEINLKTGPDFRDHKKILVSTLDYIKDIFGLFGKCAAEIKGVSSLPEDSCLQISLILELR